MAVGVAFLDIGLEMLCLAGGRARPKPVAVGMASLGRWRSGFRWSRYTLPVS
jgi:hypothetical protein